jgi:hypothetical protein
MAILDTRPPQRDAHGSARAHDRSAERHEQHAILLDRYGAHRSAGTERRQAKDERAAAAGARNSPPR